MHCTLVANWLISLIIAFALVVNSTNLTEGTSLTNVV